MSDAMSTYHTIVHPINRNSFYGVPVTVIAKSRREAMSRAKEIAGWESNPRDAQVTFVGIEDIQEIDHSKALADLRKELAEKVRGIPTWQRAGETVPISELISRAEVLAIIEGGE